MSRFFVGQRVRKVRRTGLQYECIPVGAVGVITAIGPFKMGHLHSYGRSMANCDCQVKFDGGLGFADGIFDCLEPILPEGHRACDDEFKRDLDKMLEGMPA